jgi:hypothetical protein
MIKLKHLVLENFDSNKVHGPVTDITHITPDELKPMNQLELNSAIHDMKSSGMSDEEWAKSVNIAEPISASIYSDGEIKIQDGHHRYLAAKILNKPVSVNLTAINTKLSILQLVKDRIKLKLKTANGFD